MRGEMRAGQRYGRVRQVDAVALRACARPLKMVCTSSHADFQEAFAPALLKIGNS
jgi:hypothetical protein